jgi:hypothetical protein
LHKRTGEDKKRSGVDARRHEEWNPIQIGLNASGGDRMPKELALVMPNDPAGIAVGMQYLTSERMSPRAVDLAPSALGRGQFSRADRWNPAGQKPNRDVDPKAQTPTAIMSLELHGRLLRGLHDELGKLPKNPDQSSQPYRKQADGRPILPTQQPCNHMKVLRAPIGKGLPCAQNRTDSSFCPSAREFPPGCKRQHSLCTNQPHSRN